MSLLKVLKIFITFCIVLQLFSCNAFPYKSMANNNGLPALISNPSDLSRIELNELVSKALNGVKVTLADDVFSQNNLLIIERVQHSNLQQNPVMGRSFETGHHFELIKIDHHCYLRHQETEQQYRLKQVSCLAIDK